MGFRMEADPLKSGDVVGGCRILSRLGAGAMGVVYKAHHIALDKAVAFKVLNPACSSDGTFVERFVREARSAAKLEHPNIVQVYNVGVDKDRYYIVMQYVEGESLQDVVEREGRLPLARASRVVRSVALALTEAHQKKIIHRDIKTSNILMGADGRARLTDFGLARTIEGRTDLTGTGTIMGTPGFIAPEVLQGHAADFTADQYAVGVVYYTLLTGALPFRGKTPYEIFSRQLTEEPVPLSQAAPDVPAGICELVRTAMAKDPGKRYPSVAEFVRSLDRAWRELSTPGAAPAANGSPLPAGRTVPLSRSEQARRVERAEARRSLAQNAMGWLCFACALALFFALAMSGVQAVPVGERPTLSDPFVAPFSVEDARFLPRVSLAFLGSVALLAGFLLNRRQLYFSAAPSLAVLCLSLGAVLFYVGAFLAAETLRWRGGDAGAARLLAAIREGLATPLNEAILGVGALVGALGLLVRGVRSWGGYLGTGLLSALGFAAVYRFSVRSVLAEFPGAAAAGWDPSNFYNVLLGVFGVGLVVAFWGSSGRRRSAGAVLASGLFFLLSAAALYAFGALVAYGQGMADRSWSEVIAAPLAGVPNRLVLESGALGAAAATGIWGGALLYLRKY